MFLDKLFIPFGAKHCMYVQYIWTLCLEKVWKFGLRKFGVRVSHILTMCHDRHVFMDYWLLYRCFLSVFLFMCCSLEIACHFYNAHIKSTFSIVFAQLFHIRAKDNITGILRGSIQEVFTNSNNQKILENKY